MPPIRLTVVMTHPIQYYSPWFRFISAHAPEIELNILYASEPSPQQQGGGFEAAFHWDVPLREGYPSRVLRPSRPEDEFVAGRFWGLDVPEVAEAIVESRPQAVMLSGWHSITLLRAMWACRRRRIPLLYRGDTHLDGRAGGLRYAPWRFRTRHLLRRFDRYLSVGRRSADYLRYFGIPDPRVFPSPHAVDNDFFRARAAAYEEPSLRDEARRAWNIGTEDFVCLFVGKLDAVKRPEDLIRAARLANGARIVLLFVGAGPLEASCRRLVQELGVEGRFSGFLNQSELGRAYAVSDCLVLPSETESWGLVVNEAMAAGLPCVVSDRVGCAPDLIEPGRTGEIYRRGDVEALSLVLQRLAEEKARGTRRREACLAKIQDYSYETATGGLIQACVAAVGSH